MSTFREFRRPTRVTSPPKQPESVFIAAPPSLTNQNAVMPLQMLLPVIGALTSVCMIVVLRGTRQPIFLVLAALIFIVAIIGGVGFALSSRGRQAKQAREQRENYLDYLERTRNELRQQGNEDRDRATVVHPNPHGLLSLIQDPARCWERRPSDDDFLSARVGLTEMPWFPITLGKEESPIEPADPFLSREAQILEQTMSTVPQMPAAADLNKANIVSVIGDRAKGMATVRAMIAQLAAFHTPDELSMAAVFEHENAAEWSGFDQLPHVQDPALFDGPVPARRIAPDIAQLNDLLKGEFATRATNAAMSQRHGGSAIRQPHLVIFIDDHGRHASSITLPDPTLSIEKMQITVVHLLDSRLNEPDNVDFRITLDGEHSTLTPEASAPEAQRIAFAPDALSSAALLSIARTMSGYRVIQAAQLESGGTTDAFDVTQLLGIEDIDDVKPERLWKPRSKTAFLKVPFAVNDNNQPVYLDLKEAGQDGMGPHGICVGATGSGKSEMLRTLLLSLAITHPPEDLSMILVDYKGGSAFATFGGLPHVAGLISNLEEDPQLITRARASLQGEVVRRQQMLKAADSSPSISHYRELRKTRPELPVMPHLFMVIDEFAEMLVAEPDFIDLFLQIGRIGRSIGIHLLLSSQRIEAGRLRGLDTYLSYRLGLRTFSESESNVVLGTKDAYRLPAAPGYGYLKVDTSVYERFRAGYVSGPIPRRQAEVITERPRRVFEMPTYNGIEVDDPEAEASPAPKLQAYEPEGVLVDAAITRLRADDRAVESAWLPPLPEQLALGQVISDSDIQEASSGDASLEVPIGLLDDPSHQKQDPWILDLTRGGGHVAIVGSPQSGRTTLLRTVAASLSMTYTPKQVAIYGMDLVGGGLRRLEGFPHVGGIATRSDRDRVRRLLEELTLMIDHREQVMKDTGVDSLAELRSRHANGQLPQISAADIVLLVNGYSTIRNEFDDLEQVFTRIMMRAAGVGMHLILTLGRMSDLRIAHQSLFGTKIEMRLNDPAESQVDRALATTLKAAKPGRALSDQKLIGQIALPVLEVNEDVKLGEAIEQLGARLSESWSGPSAAPIRLLPESLDPSALPDPVDEPNAVPLGIRQDTMAPTTWDFSRLEQHLTILGDTQSGKTNTLRLIAHELMARFTPDELAIAVVDPRSQLASAIPEEYLAAHAKSTQQVAGLAKSIAIEMDRRAGIDPAEVAKAPRVVILVDDHDIVAAGGAEPLMDLAPHLPTARDSRLHIVLARPVAGAARAMYRPFLQAMRDTGGSLFVMSGDRSEGQILPRLFPERFPPGRGRYARRGETPFVMQVARMPDEEPKAYRKPN